MSECVRCQGTDDDDDDHDSGWPGQVIGFAADADEMIMIVMIIIYKCNRNHDVGGWLIL